MLLPWRRMQSRLPKRNVSVFIYLLHDGRSPREEDCICMLYTRIKTSAFLSRNTNKMQLCNRIYYSKVFWRLNMFRAAHRSSSGALNCICSLWFICPYGDRPFFSPLSLGNGRSPYRHINQRLQIQFRAPDDERCVPRNMLSLQKTLE